MEVILAIIIGAALLASIAKVRERDRRERKKSLENERRWREQQALYARQVKLMNVHPINRAALRWIKEAELDAKSKSPDEVNWANSDVYVVKFLIWSVDRLVDQGLLDDEMELDMEHALENVCINDNPGEQTRYFLEPPDGGEVCCDTETLECHNWLESECVRLAQRYIDRELKCIANGSIADKAPSICERIA